MAEGQALTRLVERLGRVERFKMQPTPPMQTWQSMLRTGIFVFGHGWVPPSRVTQ